MLHVLLVEDDLDLANTLVDYLALEQIECDHIANGSAAESLINDNRYDALILDVNLPGQSGFHLCEKVRADGNDTPVLMLTARDALHDKLTGFEVGSDDYLVKPFEMAELVARIKALAMRRSGQAKRFQVADLMMDIQQHQATRGAVALRLSPTGWKLLETLMRASPKVVSKQALEHVLWGDEVPNTDSLKVHLHKLRKQVDLPGLEPLIHTVTHHGVVLKSGSDKETG
jgi:DNA-binding response OmpR family regulator